MEKYNLSREEIRELVRNKVGYGKYDGMYLSDEDDFIYDAYTHGRTSIYDFYEYEILNADKDERWVLLNKLRRGLERDFGPIEKD